MSIQPYRSLKDLISAKDVNFSIESGGSKYAGSEILDHLENKHLFDPITLVVKFTLENRTLESSAHLVEQPATCGACFLHNFNAVPEALQTLIFAAIESARLCFYTVIHASHVDSSVCDNLIKAGFTKVRSYVNKRTDNIIYDFMYML